MCSVCLHMFLLEITQMTADACSSDLETAAQSESAYHCDSVTRGIALLVA